MPPQPAQEHHGSFLNDAVTESRAHLRKLISGLDQRIAANKLDDARRLLPKLHAMSQELHRVLHPRDPVDRKTLEQMDRDVARIEKALKKGWSATVGKGILAVTLGTILGLGLLIGLFVVLFS